ncbi:MAG TPA: hypothetical protein VFY14_00730, partial [Streptomyces sp.]|nr:hypothetical protein [Streptomyces sp.]
MTTDHACQAAAEQAARGVAPVRAALMSAHRPAPRQDADDPSVEPVGTPMGAAALLTFLDGLRADLGGAMVDWYSTLAVQFPRTLGAPAAAGAAGLPHARLPNGWQSLADL